MKKSQKWLIGLVAAGAFALGTAHMLKGNILKASSASTPTVTQTGNRVKVEYPVNITALVDESAVLETRLGEIKVLLDKIPGYWALWNISKFKGAKQDLATAKTKLEEVKKLIDDLKSRTANFTRIRAVSDSLKDLEKAVKNIEEQIANAEANMAAAEK